MGMPARQTEWTADMAMALPDDGNRYEVLDGELFVTPSPSRIHQSAIMALVRVLDPYVRLHRLGWLYFAPADITFTSRRLVQPDLFVVPRADGPHFKEWIDVKELALTIEVLSPSTARADRFRKRTIYQLQGIPEYWIVDPFAQLVERWRPEDTRAEVLAEQLVWQPRLDIEPLLINVPSLFVDELA